MEEMRLNLGPEEWAGIGYAAGEAEHSTQEHEACEKQWKWQWSSVGVCLVYSWENGEEASLTGKEG